jgi:cytochrome c553
MSFRSNTIFWASGGAFLTCVATTALLPAAQAGPGRAKPATKKAAPATADGAKVFAAQCAPCHGAKGEGGPGYPRPLAGERSAGQLAAYIASAMPPGPKHASPAEAKKVAAFLYDSFYSPLAQERNRPARVALSRLTVRQYRLAVADLVGTFRPAPQRPAAGEAPQQGLKAAYYKKRNFGKEDLALERTDPQVRFNFDTQGPAGGDFDPHQFSIRWQGTVTAPDTGVYEFVVRTDHAARLWVNDDDKPLIDAWVKSGKDDEFRGSLFLVGGRSYPIRLEFSKSTQGVDDSKQKEGKPAPPARVALAWVRPKQAEEVIPARCLSPLWAPESFVCDTPFPPDDRSRGYERGDSVSPEWDEATTSAALEASDYVVAHRKELAGGKDDPEALKAFCRRFVERALRRPLDPDTERRYVARQFETAPDTETAVKRVVLLTLKSPRFLYRDLGGPGAADPYDVASRLSFTLWDSLPDDALLRAAAAGELKTAAQVQAQAERMAADPRAWYKQRDFFLQWLKVDQYPDLAKDKKRFPNFTPAVATDLRTSLDLTLEGVVRSEKSDFRELVLTDRVYLNGTLAKLYGAQMPDGAPFQPVALDPKERAGVLTHPYVLSSFAYTTTSSPIHRGVLLARNILGRTLNPPPAAFAPLDAKLHPSLTTRERVSLQTKPAGCMSCHGMINPLGFTLERFDAVGRLRAAENGKPVDARGSYEPRTGGKPLQFNGARDLARFVASSDEAHAAFVEKLFQYHVKQPVRAYGARTLPELERGFEADGCNIRNLAARIAVTAALGPAAVNTADAGRPSPPRPLKANKS